MSYINVAGKTVSLWSLLYESKNVSVPLYKNLCTNILIDVCNGLRFIHGKGFLHNDLKLDNIVIGSTLTQKMRLYIIDFGKACPIDKDKRYSLTEEQKELYKKDHTHIAPDCVMGLFPNHHPQIYTHSEESLKGVMQEFFITRICLA